MKALGIVLATQPDAKVSELTKIRTFASLPFGGRYRLIDFPLSNMVNAGITHIGIIMTQRYRSLMNHLALGADWDLDRKTGGLDILPPFEAYRGTTTFDESLDSLKENKYYLVNNNEKYIVLSDCTYIKNVNLDAVFDFHKKTEAAITVLSSRNTEYLCDPQGHLCLKVLPDGRVTDITPCSGKVDHMHYMLHTLIMERELLIQIIQDVEDDVKVRSVSDILRQLVEKIPIMAYEHKGKLLCINSLSGYLQGNLSLLDKSVREDLFSADQRHIYTNTRDSAPTKMGKYASVQNSYVAAGCVIDGTIRNSVIFRGVKIEQGAVIENSVIMEDSEIGRDAHINCAVLDKHVTIYNNRRLSGHITHPYFCPNRAKI